MKKFRNIFKTLLAVGCGFAVISSTACDLPKSSPVESVTISGQQKVMHVGDIANLEAKVKVFDVAPNGTTDNVVWKSSDPEVAAVTSDGKVFALKEGVVEITATSIEDTNVSKTISIEVKDYGFDPSLIEEGLTYSETFPLKEMRRLFKNEDLVIPEPVNLENGCYYSIEEEGYMEPWSDGTIYFNKDPSISIYLEGNQAKEYVQKRIDEGWTKVIEFEFGEDDYVLVDPESFYMLNIYPYEDATVLTVLLTSYTFGSGADTLDTYWNYDLARETATFFDCPSVVNTLKYVPFVKLGEEYDFYPTVDEEAEFYTYDYCGVDIYDYSAVEKLGNYDEILLLNGFTLANNGAYEKQLDNFTKVSITYEWGLSGNEIFARVLPLTVDQFPMSKINEFVDKYFNTFYSVPAFNGSAESYKYYEIDKYEMGFEEALSEYKVANAVANQVSYVDISAYVAGLEEVGFELYLSEDYNPITLEQTGMYILEAIKGSITLLLIYETNELPEAQQVPESDIYYSKEIGNLTIEISNNGVKENAIVFDSLYEEIAVGEHVTVNAEKVALTGTVTYYSDDENIAIVNETTGVVTGLEKGETVVFAEYQTEKGKYTDYIYIYVLGVATEVEIFGKDSVPANTLEVYGMAPVDSSETVVDASYWSLVEPVDGVLVGYTTGILTVGDISEPQDVVLQVKCGDAVATKTVTVGKTNSKVDVYDYANSGYENGQSLNNVELTGENGVTLVYSKGTGSNEPKYYNSGTNLRMYGNNTLTVTAPNGYAIKSVEFVGATISSGGKLTADDNTEITTSSPVWTGSAASVVFTNKTTGQFRSTGVKVTIEEASKTPEEKFYEAIDVVAAYYSELYMLNEGDEITIGDSGDEDITYYDLGGGKYYFSFADMDTSYKASGMMDLLELILGDLASKDFSKMTRLSDFFVNYYRFLDYYFVFTTFDYPIDDENYCFFYVDLVPVASFEAYLMDY